MKIVWPVKQFKMQDLRKNYLNVRDVTFFDIDPNRHYIKFQDPTNQFPRYLIKCNETIIDSFGNKCYCNMKPIRADRFRVWCVKKGHKCEPGEIINQITIEETIIGKRTKNSTIITEEMIHLDISAFTGKYNLALSTLSSQDFYTICCKLIAFGISQKTKHDLDPMSQAISFYRPLSKDKLRAYLVEEAFKKHQRILHSFSKMPYICVAIDEGTTLKYHNLHFVLECPK